MSCPHNNILHIFSPEEWTCSECRLEFIPKPEKNCWHTEPTPLCKHCKPQEEKCAFRCGRCKKSLKFCLGCTSNQGCICPQDGETCDCGHRKPDTYTRDEIDESFGRFFDRHEKEEREFRKELIDILQAVAAMNPLLDGDIADLRKRFL